MMQKGFAPPALLIVAVLIVSSFFVGMKYSEKKAATGDKPEITQTQTEFSEIKEDLIRRCGDIPDKAYPPYGHFDKRDGPEWSPDCRHIAWSMWESGTGHPAFEGLQRKLSGREGVFLYRDSDKTVMKIYSPTELDETPQFVEWSDTQNLIFKTKQVEYKYNLLTKETTPVN